MRNTKMLLLASALVLLSATTASAVVPPTCSPCLWISGDFDRTNPQANYLVNTNNTFGTPYASQVWVPFIPASDGNPLHKHVLITAVIFNELTNTPDPNPPSDLAGIAYGFRTGVLAGNGGKLGLHGACPSVSAVYTGDSAFGYFEFFYTCDLATKPIKVPVGTITWVNIQPKFTVGTAAWLSDAIDVPVGEQFGWGDDSYNSFFLDSSHNFVPATSISFGYEQFAVSIAGTYVD